MTQTICPFCKSTKGVEMSGWNYGKIKVKQLRCESCRKYYKFYKSNKSSWTIPKTKNH